MRSTADEMTRYNGVTSGWNRSTFRTPVAGRGASSRSRASPRIFPFVRYMADRQDCGMATDLPWFSMYPTDFLVSTAMLTPVQGWAYTQMLMYAWTNGGIPDDREACQAMTRCQLTDADWAVLRARFEVRVAQATLQATLVHSRMEAEREKARSRHTAAVEAGRRGAEARSGAQNKGGSRNPTRVAQATLPAETQGGSSNPTRVASATTTTTTTTNKTPPTPLPRDAMRRLLMREPAWRTRVERAGAGDWYVKGEDGQQRVVTEDEVIADGIAVMTAKVEQERELTLAKLRTNGLSDGDADAMYRRWLAEYLDGGPSPATVVRNDLADKSVRNIAAVWRARLTGPYNPGHGTQAQVVEAGAAGGPR